MSSAMFARSFAARAFRRASVMALVACSRVRELFTIPDAIERPSPIPSTCSRSKRFMQPWFAILPINVRRRRAETVRERSATE